MRLLHPGHDPDGEGPAGGRPAPESRADGQGPRRQLLPVRRLLEHLPGGGAGRGPAAWRGRAATAPAARRLLGGDGQGHGHGALRRGPRARGDAAPEGGAEPARPRPPPRRRRRGGAGAARRGGRAHGEGRPLQPPRPHHPGRGGAGRRPRADARRSRGRRGGGLRGRGGRGGGAGARALRGAAGRPLAARGAGAGGAPPARRGQRARAPGDPARRRRGRPGARGRHGGRRLQHALQRARLPGAGGGARLGGRRRARRARDGLEPPAPASPGGLARPRAARGAGAHRVRRPRGPLRRPDRRGDAVHPGPRRVAPAAARPLRLHARGVLHEHDEAPRLRDPGPPRGGPRRAHHRAAPAHAGGRRGLRVGRQLHHHAGGDLGQRSLLDPGRVARGRGRLHQQHAGRGHARLRRAAVHLRARVAAGRGGQAPRHPPDRPARAQRAAPRRRAGHRVPRRRGDGGRRDAGGPAPPLRRGGAPRARRGRERRPAARGGCGLHVVRHWDDHR